VILPGFGAQSTDIQARYRELPQRMAAAGLPPISQMGPVISNFPIWWAEGERAPGLGLPDEPPSSIIALARAFPGTRYLVISSESHGRWPGVIDAGGPDVACFREIHLPASTNTAEEDPLRLTRVFELVCV
jgi:hypothetical protein